MFLVLEHEKSRMFLHLTCQGHAGRLELCVAKIHYLQRDENPAMLWMSRHPLLLLIPWASRVIWLDERATYDLSRV